LLQLFRIKFSHLITFLKKKKTERPSGTETGVAKTNTRVPERPEARRRFERSSSGTGKVRQASLPQMSSAKDAAVILTDYRRDPHGLSL
jgi:hypothetical protein